VSGIQRLQQPLLHLSTTFGSVAAQGSEVKAHRLHQSGSRGMIGVIGHFSAFGSGFDAQ
jgi:hypothetical protein